MFATVRRLAVVVSATLAIGIPALAGTAIAQDVRAELAKLPVANVTGKVAGTQQGEIDMTSTTNEPFIIKVLDKSISEVVIIGTAKRDFLRSGVYLRFTTAEMDKKGNVKGELSEIAVFEPSDTAQPGIHSDDPEGTKGPWFVAGQIRSISKTGKAIIAAGNTQVKVTIPEDAMIGMEVSDYSLVKEGDEITVDGRLAQDPQNVAGKQQPAVVVAEKVQIKLAEPATAPSKKKAKPTKPKPAATP